MKESQQQRPSPPSLRMDLTNQLVWQGEQLRKLTSKAFTVLHYLMERAGQLVTKKEILQAVWTNTIVTDGALAATVREIRKALDDDAQRPQYIETVHRRGYRFIAPLTTIPPVVSSQSPTPNPQHLAPTLVGRETELAQLHDTLNKALSGERQVVFVTSEAGIGKTALVEAFLLTTTGSRFND